MCYQTKKNYNSVDLCRAVGSVVVVAAHAWYIGNGSFKSPFSFFFFEYLFRVTVPFFIISAGFFHYQKLSSVDHFRLKYSFKYIKHYLRIHIIWTLIYFPFSLMDILHHPKGIPHAVLSYIRNIFFVGADLQLWFIPTLITAVLIVSFLLSKGMRPLHILGAAAVFYCIGLFGQSWFGFLRFIRNNAPAAWSALRLAGKITVTTRNGLFYGFFFVAAGMCISYYGISITRRKAAVLFAASLIMMGIEVSLFQHMGFFREHDMCISLIPASIFLFCTVILTDLPDSRIYPVLRKTSIIVFFLHMWVMRFILYLFRAAGRPAPQPFILFILTLSCSVIGAFLFITLSARKSSQL